MTDQDFEEIKQMYNVFRTPGRRMTDEEKALDEKWTAIDVASVLIEAIEELKAKTKILHAPVSKVAREHEKMKAALRFYAGLERDAIWEKNRFLAFDHVGGLNEQLSGPYLAVETLKEIEL